MIVGVAIRHKGTVYRLTRPFRHHHLIRKMVEVDNVDPPVTGEQGFYTEECGFLTREEALAHHEKDTHFKRQKGATKLFSEDMW